MRKILSFILCLSLIVTGIPSVFATDRDYTAGTDVVFEAQGREQYTITVPASMEPGQTGNVTLSGTWANNRIVTVTAEESVTLINNINANDRKDLNVLFEGISEKGNNEVSQSFTKEIYVTDIDAALFGTWSGIFYYNAEIKDAAPSVNQYGFYYGVPYVIENEGTSYAYVFYPDKLLTFDNWELESTGELFPYDEWGYTYDSETNSAVCDYNSTFVFSEDGREVTVNGYDVYVIQGIEHGVYYNYDYVSDSGNIISFTQEEWPNWTLEEHYYNYADTIYKISMDGDTLLVNDTMYKKQDSFTNNQDEWVDGLFDSYGVRLASFDELVNDYHLLLNFGSGSGLTSSTNTLFYLIDTYPELSTGTKLVLSKKSTSLGAYALVGLDYLQELMIPNTFTSFDGHYTLSGMGIESINLPNSLTYVGGHTFNAMPNIKTLTIPDSVTYLGPYAIRLCDSLETVVLGEGITRLEEGAMNECHNLKEVTIGSNVEWISYAAFSSSENVEKIYFKGTVAEWSKIELNQDYDGDVFNVKFTGSNLNEVICSDGVTCIVHTGGTASCTNNAVCEVCGYEYGEKLEHDYVANVDAVWESHNMDNHKMAATCTSCLGEGYIYESHVLVQDENPSYEEIDFYNHFVSATCSVCSGAGRISQSHTRQRGKVEPLGEGSNYHNQQMLCKYCSHEYWTQDAHAGGTPTCLSQAICTTCGSGYGLYGAHNIVEDKCTLCGITGTIIETAHPYANNQSYVAVGTWDYSDAKSVDILLTWQTQYSIYGDGIFVVEGTDFVDGFSGSIREQQRYLLKNTDPLTISDTVVQGKVSSFVFANNNNAKFVGNNKTTILFKNVDMLTGTVGLYSDDSGNAYGVHAVITPNY